MQHLFHSENITLERHSREEQPLKSAGLIHQLSFDPQRPARLNVILLPLLKQLSLQSRWQLWCTASSRVSKSWFLQSGLPVEKSIQIVSEHQVDSVESMSRALRSGNFSAVLTCLPAHLIPSEQQKLIDAARLGQATGIILVAEGRKMLPSRQNKSGKIPSNILH